MKQVISLQDLKPHAEGDLGILLRALGVDSPIVTPQVNGKANCIVGEEPDIDCIRSTLEANGYIIREIKPYEVN